MRMFWLSCLTAGTLMQGVGDDNGRIQGGAVRQRRPGHGHLRPPGRGYAGRSTVEMWGR